MRLAALVALVVVATIGGLVYLAATDDTCMAVCARGNAREIVTRECPCITPGAE